jgi:hypothetical protein
VDNRMTTRARQETPNDVGTLWTMRRQGLAARCALIAWPGDWELRVLVDGEILLTERCPRGNEAFALAERWRGRMLKQGWEQLVPSSTRPSRGDRQPAPRVARFRAR